jgi:hypothetical protein
VIIARVGSQLVPTGAAAKALGVDPATLYRWWQQGSVEPATVTLGGHARWDLDELRAQLKAHQLSRDDA